MVRITIDDKLKQKLLNSGEVVELVDESGNILAKVLPEAADFPNGWTSMTPEISEEELKRRMESDEPGIPAEEFMARLRKKL